MTIYILLGGQRGSYSLSLLNISQIVIFSPYTKDRSLGAFRGDFSSFNTSLAKVPFKITDNSFLIARDNIFWLLTTPSVGRKKSSWIPWVTTFAKFALPSCSYDCWSSKEPCGADCLSFQITGAEVFSLKSPHFQRMWTVA